VLGKKEPFGWTLSAEYLEQRAACFTIKGSLVLIEGDFSLLNRLSNHTAKAELPYKRKKEQYPIWKRLILG
jgi:hypothetical protein